MEDSDSQIETQLKKYFKNHEPFSKFNSDATKHIIDGIIMNQFPPKPDMNGKHLSVALKKVSYIYAYVYLKRAFLNRLSFLKPRMSSHRRDKAFVLMLRDIMRDKKSSAFIYCNYTAHLDKYKNKLFINHINKSYRAWAIKFLQKQYTQTWINQRVNDVLVQMHKHSVHMRIAEYIAIPVVFFALPETISTFLTTITGGFFSAIGTGAMLYASHFTTINAIPRLILSIIGDGVAYGINKKRDEKE